MTFIWGPKCTLCGRYRSILFSRKLSGQRRCLQCCRTCLIRDLHRFLWDMLQMARNTPLLRAGMGWLTAQSPERLTPEPVLVVDVLFAALHVLCQCWKCPQQRQAVTRKASGETPCRG